MEEDEVRFSRAMERPVLSPDGIRRQQEMRERASEELTTWRVEINNGQRTYVVRAPDAGTAATLAGQYWRMYGASPKQLRKGIYDIRMSRAKFHDIKKLPLITEADFMRWRQVGTEVEPREESSGGEDGG